MVPVTSANGVTTWECIDPKPGRSEALARVVGARFPAIRTLAREEDGRDARRLADDAMIVSTVDTVGATLDLIHSRRSTQTLIFQILGRGGGPALTAARLGIGGVITNGRVQAEARLLFEGFATIAADASSHALTDGRDPVTAAILQPMRRATSMQSAVYFADVLERRTMECPLSFFTLSGRSPLIVRPSSGDRFSVDTALARDALDGLAPRPSGVTAAVALVSIEAAAIDVFFVHQSRTDRRKVDRILPFRASRNDATFSD